MLSILSQTFENKFLRHFIGDIFLETFPHAFKRNALEDGIKESLHHNLFRFCLRDAARLEIEERLLFELAYRRAMGTADIVRQDFQTWNGICPSALAQDDIPIRLITICFLRAGSDVDHALPHRTTLAFQGTFEQ